MEILLENRLPVSLFVFWRFVLARGMSKSWRGLAQNKTRAAPSLFSGIQRFWRSLLPPHENPHGRRLVQTFYSVPSS
jgi:hypothetical protein